MILYKIGNWYSLKGVALKESKKEIKENDIAFKSEKELLEKQNEDSNEYRNTKLNEERVGKEKKWKGWRTKKCSLHKLI